MKDLLIKHQLEECHPIREYKAQTILKVLSMAKKRNDCNAKIRALRQANQQTNDIVDQILAEIKKDRTAFCREHCGLYQLREQRVNHILTTLTTEQKQAI